MSGIVGQNLGRASGLIKSGGVGADAVDSANIADDAIDSEHYTNASIDNAHLADDAVGTDEIADNAVTLAKMAGGTDGNIISFDASGDPVAIATGSSGQLLQSAGAGAPPTFATVAGGGLVPINQFAGTSNTTNVICNGWISSTYRNYIVFFEATPATDNTNLSMVLYDSGGNISSGSYYNTILAGIDQDGNVSNVATNNQNVFQLCHALSGTNETDHPAFQATMHWQSPHIANTLTRIQATQCVFSDAELDKSYAGTYTFDYNNLLTGFYFYSSSGDIAEWDIRVYGVVNS